MSDDTVIRRLRRADPLVHAPDRLLRRDPSEILQQVLAELQPARRPWFRRARRRTLTVVVAMSLVVLGAGSAVASQIGPWGVGNPAPGQNSVIQAQQTIDGGTWTLATYTNSDGLPCTELQAPRAALDGTIHYGAWSGCPSTQAFAARDTVSAQTPVIVGADVQRTLDGSQLLTVALYGSVDTSVVSSVEVTLSNGATVPVQLSSSGYFLDAFDASTLDGNLPVSVVALDASGDVVGSHQFSPPLGAPDVATPAPGQKPVVQVQQTVDGGIWSLATYTNGEGEPCLQLREPSIQLNGRPSGASSLQGCQAADAASAQTPVVAQLTLMRTSVGAPPIVVPVYGSVDTSVVSSVEVKLSNGATVPVEPSSSGSFLEVLDASTLDGSLPVGVVGLNAAGAVVGEASLLPQLAASGLETSAPNGTSSSAGASTGGS